MRARLLPAQELGVFETAEFKGHGVFSNGQFSRVRPDNFGPIHVFNDDYMFPNTFVGMHPHANTEILTVLIEGAESHQDNLGYYQEIQAGAVQLISSGTGISHSGGNIWKGGVSRHLQIWVAPEVRDSKPGIQLKTFGPEGRKNQWQLQVAPLTRDDVLTIKQDVWCSRGSFEAGPVRYTLREREHGVLLFVLEGQLEFEGRAVQRQDTVFLADTESVDFTVKAPSDLWLMETVL